MSVTYDDVGRTVRCNYGPGKLTRVFTSLNHKVAVINLWRGGIVSMHADRVELVDPLHKTMGLPDTKVHRRARMAKATWCFVTPDGSIKKVHTFLPEYIRDLMSRYPKHWTEV